MSTQVQTLAIESSSLLRRRACGQSTLPPEYNTSSTYELHALGSASSTTSLPQYAGVDGDASPSSVNGPSFAPTKRFRIQTQGVPLVALPLPPRPDLVHIYSVPSDGDTDEAAYVSIRPTRGSGSCSLFRADDLRGTPLCNTVYRFGPGKPPKIQLNAREGTCQLSSDGLASSKEEIEVTSKGCLTRSQIMRTHLGTFEWRYATKPERRAAGADCLLVLDRVVTVFVDGGGKQEERRYPVARFVRSAEFRTEGSGRSTAGNGGRLLVDLREWADRKGDAEEMEVLTLASCVTMLKKEVDRRRLHQAIIIAGGAGGGS